MEQPHRYCTNCGQELLQEDRFCAGCGRAVHATAHVPTLEADVPVPPLPSQAEDVTRPPQAAEQATAPPSQTQWRPLRIWTQFKWQIFLFVGSVIVASLLSADADPNAANAAENAGFIVGGAIIGGVGLLLNYLPLWLVLAGMVYLIARLLSKKPPFLHVFFDWWVTIVVVISILLSGLLSL